MWNKSQHALFHWFSIQKIVSNRNNCKSVFDRTENPSTNCSCPPEYNGQFCEQCASGYTRSMPNGGPYVTCVPCQCSGDSDKCHPDTGESLDYQPTTNGSITLWNSGSHVALRSIAVSLFLHGFKPRHQIKFDFFCWGLLHCLPGFRTTRREQPTETVLVPGVIHGKFEKVAKLLVNLAVFRLAEVGNLAACRTHCIIRHNQRQSCYITSVFFFLQWKRIFSMKNNSIIFIALLYYSQTYCT